jgi:hypothetical protein
LKSRSNIPLYSVETVKTGDGCLNMRHNGTTEMSEMDVISLTQSCYLLLPIHLHITCTCTIYASWLILNPIKSVLSIGHVIHR